MIIMIIMSVITRKIIMTILKEQWFDDGSGYGGEYRIDKRIYFKIQDDDLSISKTNYTQTPLSIVSTPQRQHQYKIVPPPHHHQHNIRIRSWRRYHKLSIMLDHSLCMMPSMLRIGMGWIGYNQKIVSVIDSLLLWRMMPSMLCYSGWGYNRWILMFLSQL